MKVFNQKYVLILKLLYYYYFLIQLVIFVHLNQIHRDSITVTPNVLNNHENCINWSAAQLHESNFNNEPSHASNTLAKHLFSRTLNRCQYDKYERFEGEPSNLARVKSIIYLKKSGTNPGELTTYRFLYISN